MHMHKLFKILVLGGAVAGGAAGCATNQPKPAATEAPAAQAGDAGPAAAAPTPAAPAPTGAAPAAGGGGGVSGW